MLIAVVGLVGFFGLSVREYPDVDPPVVSVQTHYTGAAASVVETRITQVLEDQLSGVEGLQTITSRSQRRPVVDHHRILPRPRRSIRPPTTCATGSAAPPATCPRKSRPPEVRKVDADASPILFLVVSKPGWSRLAAQRLCRPQPARPLLLDRRRRAGLRRRRGAAGDAGLAAARAARRLRPDARPTSRARCGARMSSFPPAGSNRRSRTSPCASTGRSRTPQQFAQLVVGRGADGYLVRLGDVARVEQGPENPYSAFRLNGAAGGRPRHRPPVGRQHARGRRGGQGRRPRSSSPTLPEGMTIVVGSDDSPVHQPRDREGLGDAGRGGGAGRRSSSTCSSAAGARP